MSTILEGIRVVELALMQAAPYAAAMLGDLGAEVIKVEEPGVGDPMRRLVAITGGVSVVMPGGRTVPFEDIDHSKKGITLNLKTPHGKQLLYELIEKADVFVTNYRELALRRMGMDYDSLKERYPRLIYACSSTAGLFGPESDLPGIDMVAQARCGVMMASGEAGMPPVAVPSGLCDRTTSLYLVNGIVAALFARERLGIGQRIHVSMLNAMINLQGFTIAPLFMVDNDYPRRSRGESYPLYNYFRCKDDRWLVLALYPADRYFPDMCRILKLPELLEDPRFSDDPKRIANAKALNAILAEVFAGKTYDEWYQILSQEDVLFGLIQSPRDLLHDPQVLANGYLHQWDHPTEGTIRYLAPAMEFSRTPVGYASAAPELGQHTEEVLNKVLGYDWDQINQMRDEGAI